MKMRFASFIGIPTLLLCAMMGWASVGLDQDLDGVLCLTPVEDNSVMAVELELLPGQAVTGLRWFNNDGSVAFPRVDIVKAGEDQLPVLDQVLASEYEVSGSSLGWSQLEFAIPVGGSDRPLFAVFHLPAYQERTDEGVGGGPGIGYREVEDAPACYLGKQGEDWVRMASTTRMAVEALISGGASFKAGGGPGDGPVVDEVVYKTALLPAVPNPANPATNVRFSLARDSQVLLTVYNQRGARVNQMYQGQLPAGEHLLKWRGQDDAGNAVASGVYFIKMVLREQVLSERVVIVR